MIVIGICGYAGSGKDETYRKIKKCAGTTGITTERLGFADMIRLEIEEELAHEDDAVIGRGRAHGQPDGLSAVQARALAGDRAREGRLGGHRRRGPGSNSVRKSVSGGRAARPASERAPG